MADRTTKRRERACGASGDEGAARGAIEGHRAEWLARRPLQQAARLAHKELPGGGIDGAADGEGEHGVDGAGSEVAERQRDGAEGPQPAHLIVEHRERWADVPRVGGLDGEEL